MRIGIDLDGVIFNSELMFATGAEIFDCKILKRNSIKKMSQKFKLNTIGHQKNYKII